MDVVSDAKEACEAVLARYEAGALSAPIALMTTSADQTFIRAILLIMFVRSDLRSIVRLFDREIYYIFISRGSDIFATRPNRCLGYGARNVSL